jgi:tetratricopeptide (TPR) repeat protein
VREWFRALLGEDEKSLHEAVSTGLMSLVGQPRKTLDDPRLLDLYESLIEANIGAGRYDQAFSQFAEYFGGIEGLGGAVGDFARGLRILGKFSPTGSPEDAARKLSGKYRAPFLNEWGAFASGTGQLRIAVHALHASLGQSSEEGRRLAPVERNASAVLVDAGRLPEAAAMARRAVERDPAGKSLSRLGMALHLSGERRAADEAFARMAASSFVAVDGAARVAIDVGWPSAAVRLSASFDSRTGWTGAYDAALLARAALGPASAREPEHRPDVPRARDQLKHLLDWTLRTGDMRFVVESHWIAAEIARQAGDLQGALAEIETGLTHARGCGYGLMEIDLLCLRAQARLAIGAAADAFEDAVEARTSSERPECGYAWGVARARRAAADALEALGKSDDARAERAEADRLLDTLTIVHDATAYEWPGKPSVRPADRLE